MTMIPTVHMNGDTRQTLIDQTTAVHKTAMALLDALYLASPDGRNYYKQGPGAQVEAAREHRLRQESVIKIVQDMETVLMGLRGN